jgi:hypothetical protein
MLAVVLMKNQTLAALARSYERRAFRERCRFGGHAESGRRVAVRDLFKKTVVARAADAMQKDSHTSSVPKIWRGGFLPIGLIYT